MKELTDRQKEVLSFITGYIQARKYSPTIREISDHFGISVKGAYDHVKALQKKGCIKSDMNRSRTIGIVAQYEDGEGDGGAVSLPLLGTVAAGRPILAEENFEGSVAVPSSMLRKSGSYFALRVRGDSMTGAGIFSGDLAIIQMREVAEDGEIVVAMVDDAVTLKRFFREQHRVRLQAENPAYHPIFSQDVRVIGKLAGIYRSYE